MLNFSRLKITFILLVCLASIFLSLPTFLNGKSGSEMLPGNKINLGLDLRGGSYLLLEVDFDSYIKEQLENLKNDIRASLRKEKVNGQPVRYVGGINVVGQKVTLNLVDKSVSSEVTKIIRAVSPAVSISQNDGKFEITYDDLSLRTMKKNLIEQSIEIVRRRVDETGTREPDIQRQGDDRILLQVPGLDNPEHLKGLLGKTAKMTFHLLNDSFPYPDTTSGTMPQGTVRLKSENGQTAYAIKSEVMLSGDLLVNASPGVNSYGQPVVNLHFNNLGARKFGDITKENVGKPFAIVLDDKVITAPVIRSAILGGTAEISGNFTTQEASDTALLLRAGALPAPLKVIEERSVGPSLGADSIEAGKKAIIYGLICVTVFMAITYGLFGLFANIALVMNMIMIVAIMSLFGATLTLPGIAGIVLTMGMAVDANVLIYERIREEIRRGRSPFAAIEHGFQLAFGTIFDSNITTLIVGFLLYVFGSGAVKGFAVTLSVGILASMFSAVLLTRLMVVLWLKKTRPKTIPI